MRKRGFTLIELLIVMAVLAVLSVAVFSFIDPIEMLSRARDTGRISGVTTLGKAVRNYFTNFSEEFPPGDQWQDLLVDNQELKNFPAGIPYFASNGVTPCTTNAQPATNPTYCYALDDVNDYGAIVYSKLESAQYRNLCNFIGDTYFVYSTQDGGAGVICEGSEPVPWESGTQIYVDL